MIPISTIPIKMRFFKSWLSPVSSFLKLVNFILCLGCLANATIIEIRNNCSHTVWAAAIPGGGRKLKQGETWTLNVSSGDKPQGHRIWGRTNCTFDETGRGKCETGDCGGLLHCQSYGQPPNTIAEYSLNPLNLDFFDISLVEGFNLPMQFSPTSNGCSKGTSCSANINNQCPEGLKASGGCHNPCTVYKTNAYCCNSSDCGPTYFSKFFKEQCPNAYSYPLDDANTTFTCPAGTNYRATFCPDNRPNARIQIQNNCSYTVWAAANPGGGKQLNQGETWTLNVTWENGGSIWGRTNCKFNSNGRGKCESGDCDGLLDCEADGRDPYTLVEYGIRGTKFAISLVNGFNIPMEFSPSPMSINSEGCQRIKCAADVNGPCPMELRDPGGCNNPCTIFRNDQFCCYSGSCRPSVYSSFFGYLCTNAILYPGSPNPYHRSILNSCPNATDYNVMFCP